MGEDWHLDKKVPISILGLVFIQLLGFLWYVADIRKDVELLKLGQTIAENRDVRQDRIISESISMLRADIQILTSKVDRLVEKGNNGYRKEDK
jgi:Tfp pilus assembly protein PilO